jgi:hypothetical protein
VYIVKYTYMIKLISVFTVLIMASLVSGKSKTQKHYDINGKLMGESKTIRGVTRHHGVFTLRGIPESTRTRVTSKDIRLGILSHSYDKSGMISGKSNRPIDGRRQYYDKLGRYQGHSISDGSIDYHYNVFGHYMGKTETIKKEAPKRRDGRLSSMTEWRSSKTSSTTKQPISPLKMIHLKKARNNALSYGNSPKVLIHQPRKTLIHPF